MPAMHFDQLTGQDTAHLCAVDCAAGRHCLTPATAGAFAQLAAAAHLRGFELAIASAHRDFQRQLAIWNAKADGRRPVLDPHGVVLDIDKLSERELVFAILRWSALPGMSRHHWGSDLDVYDAAAVGADYQLQLIPAECAGAGVFGELHRWLDQRIEAGQAFGFFRPYDRDCGGVAPEPWHLSFSPEARTVEQLIDRDHCYDFLQRQPLALRQTVLDHFEEIYSRFIQCGARVVPPGAGGGNSGI